MSCGVYEIRCIVSNRVYIGSAVNVKYRWTNHKRLLNRGTHYNKFLQVEWRKHGPDNFVFSIMENTNRETRMSCEQKWLDAKFDNQQQCYNMQPFAGTCRGRKVSDDTKAKISKANFGKPNLAAAKTYDVILVSPTGEKYGPITNLEAFAKTYGLRGSSLWKVIKGAQYTTKGWRLFDTNTDFSLAVEKGRKISDSKLGKKRPDVFIRCAKKYDVWLLDPEGNEHLLEIGLCEFARKHNLSSSKLSLLLLKKNKTHKGWKLK